MWCWGKVLRAPVVARLYRARGTGGSAGGDAIDLCQFLGRELPAAGPYVLLQLLWPGRSGDHACDGRLCEQPTERQFQQSMVALFDEIAELLGDRPVAF